LLGETTPVAVKIKLKRMGKIHAPYYRVVVADARSKRDGRAIEEIGKYHPKLEPSLIEIDSERAQYWLSVGAQPTDPVRNLLKITGDWQRFHGEDGVAGTLKTGAAGPDKKEAFAAALRETHGEAAGAATTQKGRGRRFEAKHEARASRTATTAGADAGAGKAEATKAKAGRADAEEGADAGQRKAAKADSAADALKADELDQAADDGEAGTSAAHESAAEANVAATAHAGAADEAGSGA
jgi:small subunit ribosomal protein S16